MSESSTTGRSTSPREVKSAGRTLEVLEFLAARQNRPVRLRELREALNVPRSSLHALLRTLVGHGWVRVDQSGLLYTIGIRALLAGTTYLDTDPCLPLVHPILDELRDKLNETFHFGRLDGTDIVFLATRESTQYVRQLNRVGRRLPAYTTSLGKSILASLSDDDLKAHLPDRLEPLTPNTITDKDALAADLEETRHRGYAIENQENAEGVTCFGVALQYATPATDAISASVPISRITPQRQDEIVAELRKAADKIDRVVGPMSHAMAWISPTP
ncbi:IclR family transcriptional regulator [Nocardioides sp. NPDC127514]|uniref:IclR family transcriptional regulator n=1 Tax=unclassified Nocardioides TaxID=2615069 RepID=UPI0033209080